MAQQCYVYPPGQDRTIDNDVLCIAPIDFESRVCMYVVRLFDLPVDLCGVETETQLYGPELLQLNPMHSLPFLLHYAADGDVTCINGFEAITTYLISEFADQVPASFSGKAFLVAHIGTHCCDS